MKFSLRPWVALGVIGGLMAFPVAMGWTLEEKVAIEGEKNSPETGPSISEGNDEIFTREPGAPPSEGEELPIGFPKPPAQGEGLKLGLKDCVQMALLNNREIKVKDYEIDVAKAKLQEARPRGIPIFEYEFLSAPAPRDVDDAVKSFFSGDITYFQRGKIAFGVPLLSFGKLKLAQELAKTGIQAETEKKHEKQNDVILNIHKLYYGLLLANDVYDLLEDALKHLDSEIYRRENSKEPSDPVELVRLKLFRYEVLKRLGETEKKTALAREGILIQMGLERGTPFTLEEQHLQPIDFDLKEFEHYLELNRKFHPKGKLVDLGLRATEKNYQLEKRKIAPDVGFGGFYEFGRTTNPIEGLALTDDFNDPFNFNRVGFGLRVKGEININSYRAKVKQAQAEYFKTAVGKLAAQDGLALDLKESYLNVLQGRQDMENAHRAMKLARQFVFITKTNVDIGVGDKKDYSDALQAYLVARGRYLETMFEYNVSVANLQSKIGGVALFKEKEGIGNETQPSEAGSETQPH